MRSAWPPCNLASPHSSFRVRALLRPSFSSLSSHLSAFHSFWLEIYFISLQIIYLLTQSDYSCESNRTCTVNFNGSIDKKEVTFTEKPWEYFSAQLRGTASSWGTMVLKLATCLIAFDHGILEPCWRRVMRGAPIRCELQQLFASTRGRLLLNEMMQPPLIEQTVGEHFASIVRKFGDRTA